MDESRPAECPSCGRFVGPYDRCPHCGAHTQRRMAVRAWQYGSLLLAVAGLAVLFLVARRSEVPSVPIAGLEATMNWAYLRLEGVVSRQPEVDAETGSLKLWVWDGTGEIMAVAYRTEARELLAGQIQPVMGDAVTLEGTLRVKEDFQYLVLDVPQRVEVRPVQVVDLAVAEVEPSRRYQQVRLRGVVRGVRQPYEGLQIVALRDASGEIDVALGGDLSLPPGVEVGEALEVVGAVDVYRGAPQISVGRATDLVPLAEAISLASQRALADLSAADVGRLAEVEGRLARVDPFSAGVRCSLDDGQGQVTLLLWQDLYEALPQAPLLQEGTVVRVLGEVAEYRGELEIVPQLPSDVEVLAEAEHEVPARQLGELTVADRGRIVAVEGVLRSLRVFSAGVNGQLDDGTGTVTLLLWQEVYDGLAEGERLAPGAVLRVEGEVVDYKGQLEVVPRAAADVRIVGQVELPRQEVPLGQLSADDAGQVVEVAGAIVEAAPFSRGQKYTLDDGSGAVTLLLWQEVYDGLEDREGLVPGAQVAVRGEVAEYLGELEIVPQVPADVLVTARAAQAEAAEAAPEPTTAPEPVASVEPAASPESAASIEPAASVEPTATPTARPKPSPSPVPTAETRTIGAIGPGDVGTTLAVARAGVTEVGYFSKGIRYTLTDGTGSITLLVWQDVLEGMAARFDLVAGSQVRVTGRIDQYEGALEIVPRQGAAVEVISRGERLPVEDRPVGQITASDEGRIFRVEGTVARLEARDYVQLWLNDGSGELLAYLPERLVPYLPAGLAPGMHLRITGEIDIYQGTLEIIPLAGADVEVR